MELLRKKRLVQIFYLAFFLFFILAVRLGVIQLVKGEDYAADALARETITVPLEDFSRGEILDRHLQPLTRGYWANRVVIFPPAITGAGSGKVAEELAKILGCAEKDIRDALKISDALKTPQILPDQLTPRQAEAIRESSWPGILVVPVHFRYGPDPLAVQVVGYLGRGGAMAAGSDPSATGGEDDDWNGWTGQTGLERYYDRELRVSRPQSYARLYTDAQGVWLQGLGVEVNTKQGDPGRQNVVTTIDAHIQQIVEKVLDAHVKKGAVVVMDARSGDILALASRPKYHPAPGQIEQYLRGEPGALLDQCVGLFAPGSLFKVVVAAAALAEGIVTPETTFSCRGAKDWPVRCWSEHGHGVITFQEAFAQSCNPVFARLALELGAAKLIAYARLFGLDDQRVAGYPVPADLRQNLDLIAAPHNLVNSSLGQGPVLATPVQITAMMNTVVNGGKYLPPRLVRELRAADGRVTQTISPGPARQAVSPEVARQLKQMLAAVTTKGIGQKANLPGFGSAGKTGSAQVGDGSVNAWFCGYAPRDEPAYVVTVLVQGGTSGSQTAAPLFKMIVAKILEAD